MTREGKIGDYTGFYARSGNEEAWLIRPSGLDQGDVVIKYLEALFEASRGALTEEITKTRGMVAVTGLIPHHEPPTLLFNVPAPTVLIKVTPVPDKSPIIAAWGNEPPDYYFQDKDNLMGMNWMTSFNLARRMIFGIPCWLWREENGEAFREMNQEFPPASKYDKRKKGGFAFPLGLPTIGFAHDWHYTSGPNYVVEPLKANGSGQGIWDATLVHWSKFKEKEDPRFRNGKWTTDDNKMDRLDLPTGRILESIANSTWRTSRTGTEAWSFRKWLEASQANIASALQDAHSLFWAADIIDKGESIRAAITVNGDLVIHHVLKVDSLEGYSSKLQEIPKTSEHQDLWNEIRKNLDKYQ